MPEDEIEEYLNRVIINEELMKNESIIDLALKDDLVLTKPDKLQNIIDLNTIFNKPLNSEMYQGLLILNQDITINFQIFKKIWNSSQIKICCDGGIQRLYNFTVSNENVTDEFIPDYLIGDFDSLKIEIKNYYQQKGTIVIKQETQLSSDLSKAISVFKLAFVNVLDSIIDRNAVNFNIDLYDGIHKQDHDHAKLFEKTSSQKDFRVIVLSGLGGRIDQCIQNMSQLYQEWINLPTALSVLPKMIFVNKVDLVFKIPKKGFYITWPAEWKHKNFLKNCGILPIGEPNKINYSLGYKWDVKNFKTTIVNGFVSSSNRYSCATGCYTDCEKDIIINIELDYAKIATQGDKSSSSC
ncbi:hypothetical protein QEN19_002177 [Hanseniaspora menglaensis]